MRRLSAVLTVAAALAAAPSLAQVSTPEREALIDLYNSTGGPSWNDRDGWLGPIGSECSWTGVECDEGHVAGLALSSNNLQGQIPEALQDLPFLQWLGLGENSLTGPVPAWLAELPRIEGLALNQNRLEGTIPAQLAGAAGLIYLSLTDNQLEGTIPPELGSLPALEALEVAGNRLTGTIPPVLGQLETLTTLSLGYNMLTGTIPSELGNLANLEFLDLALNQLTGTIPGSLQNLTRLAGLWLSANQLQGTVPTWIGSYADLVYLSLDSNQLVGSIPPELGNLNLLESLDLTANLLDGTIPPELGSLANLRDIWLGVNLLSGTVPPELGNLTQVRDVWLSLNRIEGPIPPELGNLTQLEFLGLDNNRLSGPIPSELGNLAALQELYLFNNDLSGTLPPELGNLSDLRLLSLGNCHLEGPIPSELGNLGLLDLLFLSSNALVGEIPASLSELGELDEGGLELWHNGLYAADDDLGAFLDSRHSDGEAWRFTQTVAPEDFRAEGVGTTDALVAWTPILFNWTPGSYQVWGSTTPGGSYELLGETSSKEASSLELTGLAPDTTYHLVIRTVTPPNEDNRNRVESDPSEEISVTTGSASACRVTCSAAVPASGEVGVAVTFQGDAEATGCSGTPSFAWAFGDDLTSTEQSPTHAYTSEGTYTWRLVVSADDVTCSEGGLITIFGAGAECGNGTCEAGETTWTCPSDCGLGAEATGRVGFSSTLLALPAAVGGQGGVGGTYWVTEAMLYNPGSSPATVSLGFVDDAQPGQVIASEPLTLQPGGAFFSPDFVQDLFGSAANGSVRVQADRPVMLVSRTFNDQPTGTYGQFLGAVPAQRMLRPGDVAFLIGLQEDDAFRTNVILQEVAGTATAVDLRVFSANGVQVGTTRIGVPATTKRQSRLLNLGFSDFRGYAVVQVLSGGAVVALASVVDQATGDAMTIDALHRDQATLGPPGRKAAPRPAPARAKQQTVDFTWSPERPRPGEVIQFTDLSSGGTRAWSWRFGDGTSSTQQHPTHTYAAAGTYTVTLVVSSGLFGSSFRSQTVTVTEESPSGLRYLLAVVARQPGAAGTTWRSDGWVMNPLPAGQRVFVEYHPVGGGPVERTSFVVRSGEQVRVEDTVGTLFPRAGDGKGALHLLAPQGVFVTSRTYNLGATGTFGQAIPALAAGDLLAPGDSGRLLKLKSTAQTRCNIGFTDLDGLETRVSLELLEVTDGGTAVAAQATYDLEPYENVQVNRVFESLGLTGEYERALAVVTVTSGGRVYAYASNVDASTGDAEFIPAMKE